MGPASLVPPLLLPAQAQYDEVPHPAYAMPHAREGAAVRAAVAKQLRSFGHMRMALAWKIGGVMRACALLGGNTALSCWRVCLPQYARGPETEVDGLG